jgi:hypothetical protein
MSRRNGDPRARGCFSFLIRRDLPEADFVGSWLHFYGLSYYDHVPCAGLGRLVRHGQSEFPRAAHATSARPSRRSAQLVCRDVAACVSETSKSYQSVRFSSQSGARQLQSVASRHYVERDSCTCSRAPLSSAAASQTECRLDIGSASQGLARPPTALAEKPPCSDCSSETARYTRAAVWPHSSLPAAKLENPPSPRPTPERLSRSSSTPRRKHGRVPEGMLRGRFQLHLLSNRRDHRLTHHTGHNETWRRIPRIGVMVRVHPVQFLRHPGRVGERFRRTGATLRLCAHVLQALRDPQGPPGGVFVSSR